MAYKHKDNSITPIDELNIKESKEGFIGSEKFLIFGVTEKRGIMPHEFYEYSKEYQSELLAFSNLKSDVESYLMQVANKELEAKRKAAAANKPKTKTPPRLRRKGH